MMPKSLRSTLPRTVKAVRTKTSLLTINDCHSRKEASIMISSAGATKNHVSLIATILGASFSSKSSIASSSPVSTQNTAQSKTDSRALHSSIPQPQSSLTSETPVISSSSSLSPPSPTATTDNSIPTPKGIRAFKKRQAPLSTLTTSQILRNLLTSSISSSPTLLPPSLAVISFLANSSSPLLNPDRNPFLRAALKGTFYRQFCAGEDGVEVAQTMSRLKEQGFSGIILGYAREVVLPNGGNLDGFVMARNDSKEERAKMIREEVIPWAAGTIETLRLADEGDVVAIKFSGAGKLALNALARCEPPPPELAAAMDTICSMAKTRRVKLILDAEQSCIQAGIHEWALLCMRRYNTEEADEAIIFNTYQAYLKATPSTLSKHLSLAQADGFTLGVKLVRGAYLNHDLRHLMWDTKADTDKSYDNISRVLLKQEWSDIVKGSGAFPKVSLCLATHNAASVRMAKEMVAKKEVKTDLIVAQLQGMADEVSFEILAGNKNVEEDASSTAEKVKAYKYLVWGTTGECMKYLLRRAEENKDALQRTRNTRDAMMAELARRVKILFGYS